MLAALATVEDLARGIDGGIDIDDEARAEWVLEIVSSWARLISRKSWVVTGTGAVPDDVVAVILLAARRLFTNPNLVVSWNEGPLAEKFSENAVPDGAFTPAEIAILERQWRKKGMWVKSFKRDDDKLTIGYLETVPEGKLFPAFHPRDPFWDVSIHD
jgi:hypothetical protein